MTKSWKQCKEEAGIPSTPVIPPSVKYEWFAYKNAVAYGPFDTESEAKAISKIIEKVADVESKKAHADFWKQQRELAQKANDIWYDSLREEYSHLSDATFNVIYDKSYDDGHAYGRDEVASTFEDNYYFYQELKKTFA